MRSQRPSSMAGYLCSFKPEAEAAACSTQGCLQLPLKKSFVIMCCSSFTVRGLSRWLCFQGSLGHLEWLPRASLHQMLSSEPCYSLDSKAG